MTNYFFSFNNNDKLYKNIIYKESNRKRKYSQNKFFRIKYKNLGGSSESIDTNLLLPNDPAIEYKNSLYKVKEYISFLKNMLKKKIILLILYLENFLSFFLE